MAASDWPAPRRAALHRPLADALPNAAERERERTLGGDWPVSSACDGHARVRDFKLTFLARRAYKRVHRATRCERGREPRNLDGTAKFGGDCHRGGGGERRADLRADRAVRSATHRPISPAKFAASSINGVVSTFARCCQV